MNISKDFNLTPLLAEVHFNQIKEYFLRHSQVDLSLGQLHYLAVDENEPAEKPIALCKKVYVKLSLHKPEEDSAVVGIINFFFHALSK